MNLKHWIYAIRLHTLLLSFSGITLSFLISKSRGYGDYCTYFLCLVTAIFLQMLANFSNDYGDSIKGVDNCRRIGPKRTIQSGLISLNSMKKAISIFSILSFIFGFILIYKSIKLQNIFLFFFYFVGILICIYSSIKYSIGSYPYGYLGMGDLSVLIFFGFISIGGSYFLYTKIFPLEIFFLSLSIGLLNISVLNINNMRDIDNDYKNGKYTVAGILGIKYSRIYHILSVILSILLGFLFNFLIYKNFYQWIFFILNIPFLIQHLNKIIYINNPKDFNYELKKLVILTFSYSMSIGIGALYSS